jgi:UDP-MurNAc hydroxylase
MRATALGHAGLKVETGGATLLIDPWFSPEGAFQASWFQYPDNSHLIQPPLFEATAIVISHEHLDHVDPWFLSQVSPDVPVVVPRYPSPVLKRKIQQGGPREINEVPQWERTEIAEGTTVFFVSEPPMNHDSAIVVEADGQTLLDLNDARLFPVQLREIKQKVGGGIDMFAFQGAGASWYPICYRYPKEQALEASRQKRLSKFGYCLRSMKIVDPVVGVPFAGPPAFLDPALYRHNAEAETGIFPDQEQVVTWLHGRGLANTLVLLPGDVWDLEARAKNPDPHWAEFSFEHRWEYLESYARRRRPYLENALSRYPEPSEPMWEQFRDYFERLLTMSQYFNERIGMRVGFDISGPDCGQWTVDFRPDSLGVYHGIEECNYLFSFESRWLPPLLDGSVPWEDFFLSLRFEAWRNPDVYNDHLLGLLKFAEPKALDAVERFETTLASDERITLHSEGRTYSVQRYCPHAGNDLLHTGEILPGNVLRCLAHHYEFDLTTGRCLTGNCPALVVELLDDGSLVARQTGARTDP